MSTLYVTEYADLAYTGSGNVAAVAGQPYVANQVVTISASSTQTTNAFQTNTRFIRLHNDGTGPCSVKFGTNPTAVANTDPRMAANQTEYYSVPMSQSYKVAVITST